MNDRNQKSIYLIKEINELGKFEKLRTIWDFLANKQGAYTPFLCFDWFKMWLGLFLKDNKLLILLVYKGDQLVAIAPFLLLREKFKSITVKKIELIGNVYSPARNFIFGDINDEEKKECLSEIFEYLFNYFSLWDAIEFCPLLEEDKNCEILQQVILEKGYKKSKELYDKNWYLNGINYSAEEYLKKRPHAFRNSLRKRRRKIEELGRLEFKMIKDSENIDKYMDCYYDVYARSWKKREDIGPTFHRALAGLAAAKGWLRLGILFLNDIPVAALFCIVSNKVGFFLKVSYDKKYKEYGLGNIIHYETIRHMIDHDRIESIDLGAGSEEFKKMWVSESREMKRILLFNNSIKGDSLAILNNRILPIFNKYTPLSKFKNIIANRLR